MVKHFGGKNMLQQICNAVVLLGATLAAIKTIFAIFGKPITFFKRAKNAQEQRQNDKLCEQIKNQLMKEIDKKLEAILELNEKQSKDIKNLTNGSKDLLRKAIISIYKEGKYHRTLSETTKEILDDLYHDYKAEGGNHYIDNIYHRMEKWDIDYEDYETDKDGEE